MSNAPETRDPQAWHKHFAIECNNRAWDLASKKRTPDQDAEMLRTAYASAYHWHIAGDELNNMRAAMLLAQVHALLGDGLDAMARANEMKGYFLSRETPDWEVAFVHTIHAHAAWVAKKPRDHAASYAEAEKALAAIADEEDRKIVMETFEQVPQP